MPSLLGLRDEAIHAAFWIASSRSPSNDGGESNPFFIPFRGFASIS
jgi:hypothetical protein